MIILGKVRPLSRHLIEAHPQVSIIARRADWKPRWYLLAVPTEAFMGSARSVFSWAALDERRECYVPAHD